MASRFPSTGGWARDTFTVKAIPPPPRECLPVCPCCGKHRHPSLFVTASGRVMNCRDCRENHMED